MTLFQKISLTFLRVALGCFYFYAGISKVLDPKWSAAGYLQGAKSAVWLYQALLTPNVLPFINFVNMWGLTLLGVSLILGAFVRVSSSLGVVLMFLYYLAILEFPMVGPHAYIVDEHIIYIGALLVLGALAAGRTWGFDAWCGTLPFCKRHPKFRNLLG